MNQTCFAFAASRVLLFEETALAGFFSRKVTEYFLEAFFYASSFVFIFVPRCRRLSHRETMVSLSGAKERRFGMIDLATAPAILASAIRPPRPCDRTELDRSRDVTKVN